MAVPTSFVSKLKLGPPELDCTVVKPASAATNPSYAGVPLTVAVVVPSYGLLFATKLEIVNDLGVILAVVVAVTLVKE